MHIKQFPIKQKEEYRKITKFQLWSDAPSFVGIKNQEKLFYLKYLPDFLYTLNKGPGFPYLFQAVFSGNR